jgi:ribosome-associated protein
MEQKEKISKIIKALDSKKAEDIQGIKITELTILADYFIIANGTSTTHTRTLADEVEFQLSECGIKPTRTEGYNSSNWIILDYSDVVVHVFYKDTRDFYKLERLWADGEKIDIKDFMD